MTKRILITGAASGFGKGTALELARRGHSVIAGVQIAPQKTELMKVAEEAGVESKFRNVVPDEVGVWIQAMDARAWEAGKDDSLWIDPATL